ncbi:hypothetical protein H6A07_02235 [Olsenella uli]|uniref:hypothetical protein n=1 Tax=Olsenella uli TaxID=133926 RepID=UPI00195C62B8|nr:hypothetical protein [Olsenella uli]MBM6675565.1 hypothetical protein [Olsenella uli]
MSGRDDIRMHVEHLFEGRTLDAETIELKEEIYGNLVARFDDYVAQGMDEDEAYRRTCEAVTSVEDVLDGEKDGAAAADRTVAAPAAEALTPPRRRWSTGAIVAAAVIGVLVVGMVVVTAFNLLNTDDARTAYDSTTDATVEQVTDGDSPAYQDDATTGGGRGNGNGTGAAPQDGTGNGYGATTEGSTGLDAEVYAHSADELAAYEGMTVSSEPFLAMMNSLPLGFYAHQALSEPDTGTIEVTYTYDDRDALARDDDCVDRALVYDVVAAMSVTSDLQTLRIVEVETEDDGELDRDVHVFDRATVEGILGFPLNADLLTADAWNATRNQVMTEHYWDAIWESADVD